MDRILLLCCRSCLKGDGDNMEYYTILGLADKHVDQEAIKKAFKKASLNYHPDKLAQRGIEVTAENKLMFLKLKEAYDVLSDPKRKRLYDDLGASGLKLVETPSQVNPVELIKNFQKNRSDRVSIALIVALVFASLLVLPVLFSLKCDGTLGKNAPWVAIWTPMWLVDLAALILAALLFLDQQEKVDDNGDPIPHESTPLITKILNMTTTILFILIQIFLFMRLDGYITWNWFAIFSPWLAYEFVQVLMIVPVAFGPIPTPDLDSISLSIHDEESGESDFVMKRIMLENEYFEKLFTRATERKSFVGHVLRAWLAIFLALKLNGQMNVNWGLVLLPVWVSLLAQYLFAWHFKHWAKTILDSIDPRNVDPGSEMERAAKTQQAQQLISAHFIAILLAAGPAFMAILLVSRLQAATFTTFVILLPIFVVLCCCCCIVFCGITCLANIDTDEISRSLDRNTETGVPGENPMGEASKGYDPPRPVPPAPSSASEGGAPDQASSSAYGTFSDSSAQLNKQQGDLIVLGEDFKEGDKGGALPEAHPVPVHQLLPQTNIDADID